MNNSFNTHNNHALIQRQQNYVMEKKLLSIHSEDRDFTQFPNSNNFSIDIGESMTNVESVRLVSYAFPNNCYNISTSYQNTKLTFQYTRDVVFDVSALPDQPTSSPDDFNAAANIGGADFKLGAFQCILDHLFPGSIRTFATRAPVVPPEPNQNGLGPGNEPTFEYYLSGNANADYVAGQRAMVYATSSDRYIATQPTLDVNFGILGLPDDTTIFYQNAAGTDWIAIPFPHPSSTPNAAWPNNIEPWKSAALGGPVDEADWNGKFKITFQTPDLTITVPEGSYSPPNLAAAVQNKMNEVIMSIVNTPGHQYLGFFNSPSFPNIGDINDLGRTIVPSTGNPNFPPPGTANPPIYTTPYSNVQSPFYSLPNVPRSFQPLVVSYNSLTNNMLMGVTEGSLIFKAGNEITYDFERCSPNKFMWNQYTKWGLPNYMGFDKATYDSFDIDLDNIPLQNVATPPLTDVTGNVVVNQFIPFGNGLILYSDANNNWISASGPTEIPFYLVGTPIVGNLNFVNAYPNRTVSILNSPNNVNLMGEDCIYMEMEKFNNINEIYPFSERTNTMYNCDYGHKSDSAFAIIPLTQTPYGTELGNRTSMNTNVFMSEPPIKNINRLEFKFRYHDGRLVDFKNLPFSFVLEFNMLREEQARNKFIRIPHLY